MKSYKLPYSFKVKDAGSFIQRNQFQNKFNLLKLMPPIKLSRTLKTLLNIN